MYGNELRLPGAIREAAAVVSTIEGATSSAPAYLDTATGKSLTAALRGYTGQVDEFYDRRDELFSPARARGGFYPDAYDYPGILRLTEDVLRVVPRQCGIHRGLALGLGAVQLAAAGADVACRPLRIPVEQGQAVQPAVIKAAGGHATNLFSEVFKDKVRGDFSQLPLVRLRYPGYIMDGLHAFWRWTQDSKTANLARVCPGIYAQLPDLLSRFPAKTTKFDIHSIVGRPDSATARREYMSSIAAFEQSSSLDAPPIGLDVRNNMNDVMGPIAATLRAAVDRGYPRDKRLQIAVHNSGIIGRLCERTTDGMLVDQAAYALADSGSEDLPTLTIAHPETPSKTSTGTQIQEKLRRREQEGGICPARYLLPLDRDGATHSDVQTLASAIYDIVGSSPPLLHEHRESLRVDVAALAVNYVLLVLGTNPDALSLMAPEQS